MDECRLAAASDAAPFYSGNRVLAVMHLPRLVVLLVLVWLALPGHAKAATGGCTVVPGGVHQVVPAIYDYSATPTAANTKPAPRLRQEPQLEEWSFHVWLDGEHVGMHRLSLVRAKTAARVQSLPDIGVQRVLDQLPMFADGVALNAFVRWHAGEDIGAELAAGSDGRVQAEVLGEDVLEIAGTSVDTQRLQIRTDGSVIDLWYERDSGRWLGLRGTTATGEELRYELRSYRKAQGGGRVVI
jgi:hypothetical protein